MKQWLSEISMIPDCRICGGTGVIHCERYWFISWRYGCWGHGWTEPCPACKANG